MGERLADVLPPRQVPKLPHPDNSKAGQGQKQPYIGCAIGLWNVGFVMIAYGASNAVCFLVFGRLVQFVGHTPLFLLAFLVHGGTQITMLVWPPAHDSVSVILFYILAVLWGVGDAVVTSQLNGTVTSVSTEYFTHFARITTYGQGHANQ